GSHELVAEESPGAGWAVLIDAAPWAAGLEEREALATLDDLRRAYPHACPCCGRVVGSIRGKRAAHNVEAYRPGAVSRSCPGAGARVGR
ncbi:MAG TPA: hypothetical protein VMV51_12700, partial [Gemmatimonadaceae bacterium]|nr:hypothetical protein [Gemmatimonadaceae bacterium]